MELQVPEVVVVVESKDHPTVETRAEEVVLRLGPEVEVHLTADDWPRWLQEVTAAFQTGV